KIGRVQSTTFRTVEQVVLLPAASATVNSASCRPTCTSVPVAGSWLISNSFRGEQLSEAPRRPLRSGTAAWQLVSARRKISSGQFTTGDVTSTTLTVVEQVV